MLAKTSRPGLAQNWHQDARCVTNPMLGRIRYVTTVTSNSVSAVEQLVWCTQQDQSYNYNAVSIPRVTIFRGSVSSEPTGCNQDRFYGRYTIQMTRVTVRALVFQALLYCLLVVVFVYSSVLLWSEALSFTYPYKWMLKAWEACRNLFSPCFSIIQDNGGPIQLQLPIFYSTHFSTGQA
jgi:hypothetical protein